MEDVKKLEQERESDSATIPEKVDSEKEENGNNWKQIAKEKLENELNNANDKEFADPVIKHLLKRVEESDSLASDICQEHKTWKKCFDYIFAQAKKQANGKNCAVRDDVVYEWAEDYYHKDDKEEEEKKAREAAERKKKQKAKNTEDKTKEKKAVAVQEETETPEPKPKKSGKDMDGQLDMFSFMGM